MNSNEIGGVEAQHHGVWVGAGIGGLTGGFFGSSGYLAIHSVTDYQGATFTGFMMATLGGAFQGAVSGASGSYMIYFATSAFNFAWNAGVAWIDALYQSPENVGGD